MLPNYIDTLRPDEPRPPNYYSYGRTYEALDEIDRYVVDNRERAVIVLETSDPHADYSYDDWAMVQIGEYFYVFETSGCSCPSPSETWGCVRFGDRAGITEWLNSALGRKESYSGSGYTEFHNEMAKIWPEVQPMKQEERYDW